MNLSEQTAKHFREVFFGGNWTCSNLKDNLEGVTWQEATTRVYSFNTIATLVFHIAYFADAALKVLQGGPLDAHDKFSFDHPPINSKEDWDQMLRQTWKTAQDLAHLIEQMPENKFLETFCEEKYGTYFRNLHGIIEHTHYHLGQIVLIKKIIQAEKR